MCGDTRKKLKYFFFLYLLVSIYLSSMASHNDLLILYEREFEVGKEYYVEINEIMCNLQMCNREEMNKFNNGIYTFKQKSNQLIFEDKDNDEIIEVSSCCCSRRKNENNITTYFAIKKAPLYLFCNIFEVANKYILK